MSLLLTSRPAESSGGSGPPRWRLRHGGRDGEFPGDPRGCRGSCVFADDSDSLVMTAFSATGARELRPQVARHLLAQDIRQEGQQPSQRGDVSDPPGRDVLDPTDHAPRRPCARVEVQHERPVGRQLERDGATGRVAIPTSSASCATGRRYDPRRCVHDGTAVRLRLEGGEEAVRPRGDGRRSTPDVRGLLPGPRQRAARVRRRGGRPHPEGIRGPAPARRGRRAARHEGGAAAGRVGQDPRQRRRAQGHHPRDPPRARGRSRGAALHRDRAAPGLPLHRPPHPSGKGPGRGGRRTAHWSAGTACSRSSRSGSRAPTPASASSCSSPAKPASARPRCSTRFWRARRPIRT